MDQIFRDRTKLCETFCQLGVDVGRLRVLLRTVIKKEYVLSTRQSCAELSWDLVILGQLPACTNRSPGVVTSSNHIAGEREQSSTAFCHPGRSVCAKIFRT